MKLSFRGLRPFSPNSLSPVYKSEFTADLPMIEPSESSENEFCTIMTRIHPYLTKCLVLDTVFFSLKPPFQSTFWVYTDTTRKV